jgi:hypothetical protein
MTDDIKITILKICRRCVIATINMRDRLTGKIIIPIIFTLLEIVICEGGERYQ